MGTRIAVAFPSVVHTCPEQKAQDGQSDCALAGKADAAENALEVRSLRIAIVLLSGCSAPVSPHTGIAPPGIAPPGIAPLSGDTVTLLDHGWHTDIGIPAKELSGPLAVFRSIFPGAQSLVFSFGKRTFLMAPAHDWSEYVLGPLPGPAAIMVTGLSGPSENAYGDDPALVLRLPKGGAASLSDFIWWEISHDQAGNPRLIDRGLFDGSLFYAAATTYTLHHTCNTWSAMALAAAGLTIDPSDVVFAGQVMTRARLASSHPLAAAALPP